MENRAARARPVPVVRLIISNNEGKVLFLRRAQEEVGGGGWCLPGGKVDYQDTVEQSAIRELREETSLEAQDLRFLFFQDSLPPTPRAMHCINFYFECQAAGEPLINHESDAWAWIGPEDMDDYDIVFMNDEGVLRYWGMEPA